MGISTGGWLIMSQPDGLLILGDHPFLNYIFFFWQRGFTNTAGFINPNLTLVSNYGKSRSFTHNALLMQTGERPLPD